MYIKILRVWGPSFLWMLLIFSLSSLGGNDLPKIPIPNISSLVHAVEYSVLGFLLLRSFHLSFPDKPFFRLALFAAGPAFLFGLSDEWHQSFVPERFCELEDLIVDALSTLLGILFYIKKAGLSVLKK